MPDPFRPTPPAWEVDWTSAIAWGQEYKSGGGDASDSSMVSSMIGSMSGSGLLSPFDWSGWSKTVGATDWYDHPEQIKAIGLEDIRRFFVALVRSNRFSEGTLVGAMREGVITAALDRAAFLVAAARASLQLIEVVDGDITLLDVDAVVNAANELMLGGGGVDGAIHRAAGPELLAACRDVEEVAPGVRCPVGEARSTPGFQLPARWIVHTVGPRWSDGEDGESALLTNAYRNSLDVAADVGARTIAFPAISTGVFGYPLEFAASDAVAVCLDWLADRPGAFDRVVLVAHGASAAGVLTGAIARVNGGGSE